ncbi:unnamed protein product [Musa hybrid cultivar]
MRRRCCTCSGDWWPCWALWVSRSSSSLAPTGSCQDTSTAAERNGGLIWNRRWRRRRRSTSRRSWWSWPGTRSRRTSRRPSRRGLPRLMRKGRSRLLRLSGDWKYYTTPPKLGCMWWVFYYCLKVTG